MSGKDNTVNKPSLPSAKPRGDDSGVSERNAQDNDSDNTHILQGRKVHANKDMGAESMPRESEGADQIPHSSPDTDPDDDKMTAEDSGKKGEKTSPRTNATATTLGGLPGPCQSSPSCGPAVALIVLIIAVIVGVIFQTASESSQGMEDMPVSVQQWMEQGTFIRVRHGQKFITRTFVYTQGNKNARETIILVHDNFDTSFSFQGVAQELGAKDSKDLRVICFDFPGLGLSSHPGPDSGSHDSKTLPADSPPLSSFTSLDAQVTFLDALLDMLETRPMYLVCQGTAAVVCGTYAGQYPTRVRKVLAFGGKAVPDTKENSASQHGLEKGKFVVVAGDIDSSLSFLSWFLPPPLNPCGLVASKAAINRLHALKASKGSFPWKREEQDAQRGGMPSVPLDLEAAYYYLSHNHGSAYLQESIHLRTQSIQGAGIIRYENVALARFENQADNEGMGFYAANEVNAGATGLCTHVQYSIAFAEAVKSFIAHQVCNWFERICNLYR